ncbi:MBL fold metallo-hydrolase [Cohnella sp. CFH 77786]|uniref:MBL fold metallo-hydrolase n=1 Tax=Cohnella sp. CFH 77786 TaxID=2662265 RepID=UPI001C60FE8C|nr:MBL fold metallo-hydrolase [Cohnella sp. CFH 77786]
MSKTVEAFAGSAYFRLKEVAEGVYAAICVPGSGSLGNAAIVDLGDATLVVDTTLSLQAARDLRQAAEQLTGRPVAYVFNTHFHGDHVNGNQMFAPEAQFIATGKIREVLAGSVADRLAQHRSKTDELIGMIDQWEKDIEQEEDEKIRQEMRWEVMAEREYVRTLPEFRLTLPGLTFDEEMWVHGSKRSARLMTFGGGHSDSDAFLYLPAEKLVVIGDLVLSGFHPTMSHANPWEWLKILDRIEAELEIDAIIPGHGEPCSIDTLREVREYLRFAIGLASGLDPNDENLDGVTIPEKYDDWLFRFDFKNNLKRIRELSKQREESVQG